MEIIGGIQVSGSVDIYEGVLRTSEASGSFSGSGYNLYDIQAEAIVGLVSLKTGSVTASVNQTDGFVVKSAISGSTITGSVTITGSTTITGRLAQGEAAVAGGLFSHAEGRWTSASQAYAHAEGIRSVAAGLYSHAEGEETRAGAYASHTQGQGTSASGSHQLVIGAFNIPTTQSHAFIIGNGGNAATRSNLLFASGSVVHISGTLAVSGNIEGINTALISSGSTSASIKIDGNNTGSFHVTSDTVISGSLTVLNGINGVDTSLISSGSGTASIKIDGDNTSSLHINTNTTISGSLNVLGGISGVDTSLISSGSATASIKLDISGSSSLQINTDTYITGSLTANSIFAESASFTYLTSIYETSSFIFLTGSTKFGDQAGVDKHEFTGSVGITGSFSTLGNSIFSGSIHLHQSTSVSGTNIFGTASFANSALTASFLSTSIYSRELHVSSGSGNDSGSGTFLQPFKTIAKAIATVQSGQQIVIHPGTYPESFNTPTNCNNVTITAANTEIGGLVNITGTVTVDQTIATIRLVGLNVQTLVHSGNKNLYLQRVTINGGLNKTGNGYLEADRITCQAGAFIVTGTGQAVVYSSLLGSVTVANAAALVNLNNNIVVVTPACTAGTLLIDGGTVYSAGATTGAVFTNAGAVIALKDIQCITPAGATARITLNSGSFASIQNVSYDRTNSTTGSSLVNRSQFQHINADVVSGSSLLGTQNISLGVGNLATGVRSLTIGTDVTASATNTIAQGVTTRATGNNSVALGTYGLASGDSSIAVGFTTTASGNYSLAAGELTRAAGGSSMAIGRHSQAMALASFAAGSGSVASGQFSFAAGNAATASGIYSFAAGPRAHARGNSAIALGSDASASGDFSIAIGDGARSFATDQVILGKFNTVNGSKDAFIVGNGSSDTDRSTIIFASGSRVTVNANLNVRYPSGSTEVSGTNIFGTASWAENAINGGASVTVAEVPPTGSKSGSLFWDTNDGNLYVQTEGPSGSVWVSAVSSLPSTAPIGGYVFSTNLIQLSTWSIDHGLGNTTPIITVYNLDKVTIPATVRSTGINSTEITFNTPTAGTAILSNGFGSTAVSASYARTASYALTTNLPPTYSQAFTASYVLTASYALNSAGGGSNYKKVSGVVNYSTPLTQLGGVLVQINGSGLVQIALTGSTDSFMGSGTILKNTGLTVISPTGGTAIGTSFVSLNSTNINQTGGVLDYTFRLFNAGTAFRVTYIDQLSIGLPILSMEQIN